MAGSTTNPEQPSSSEQNVRPPSSDQLPEDSGDPRPAPPNQIELSMADLESSHGEPVTRLGNPRSSNQPSRREKIGDCTLGRVLGKGGMGTVFLAVQNKLKREVAVKIIRAGRTDDREDLERFRREAKLAGSLHHPNIVQVFDVGEEDNLAYLVMEYIEGGTLHGYLANKPMDILHASLMLEQIARGIHYAHLKGIVHRDLKPGNILLLPVRENQRPTVSEPRVEQDQTHQTEVVPLEAPTQQSAICPQLPVIPKITDFGLAKDIGRNGVSGPLTATGIALGTPSYMAPEQARGDANLIGVRSDIYALGAILYEMLTGRPPFTGENAQQIMEKLCLRKPQPPSKIRPSIPTELEKICLKCLAKDPRRRYATAEALADDLRKYIDREAATEKISLSLSQWMRSSPPPAWLVVIGLFAIIGTAAFLLWNSWANLTEGREQATARFVEASDRLRHQQIDGARQRFEEGYHLCEQGDILRGIKLIGDAGVQFNRILKDLDQPPSQDAEAIRHQIDIAQQAVQLNLREWGKQRLSFRFDVMSEPALGFSFSPRGSWLATLDREGTLSLFDFDGDSIDNGITLCRSAPEKMFLRVDRETEPRFAWNVDQTRLAVSIGSQFREFDLKELKPVGEPRNVSPRRIFDLLYDAKATALFVISEDQALRRIDLGSGSVDELGTFAVPRLSSSLALSRDGKLLVVVTESGELRLLDPTAPSTKSESILLPGPIRSVGKSPMLDEILIGTTNGNSYRFSLATRQLVPLPNQGVAIESLGSSSEGFVALDGNATANESLRVTQSQLGVIRVLDSDSLADRATPLRTERRIQSIAPHPSQPLLALGFEEGSIGIYSVPPRLRSPTVLSLAQTGASPLIRVQFSRNGKTLMLLGSEGAGLFSTNDFKLTSEIVKPPFEILSGALHPNGNGVAFGGPRGSLVYSSPLKQDSFSKLKDAGDSRFTLVEFVPDTEEVLGYSPPLRSEAEIRNTPGKRLDTGSWVWSPKTESKGQRLENLPVIHQLTFGSKSTSLALAGQDGIVRLQSLGNEKPRKPLEFLLSSPATAVAYHEDPLRLAAGGDDGKLAVWDAKTGNLIWERIGHRQMATCLAFSPDGRLMVSGCSDGTARLWDTESGLPIGPTRHHGAAIRSIVFDPNGERFVTGGSDGRAYCWPVPGR